MATTDYGSISPRTAAYAAKEMLRRGQPYLVIERFGQMKPIPKNKTDSIKFRRYEALDNTPNTLTEGVTPSSKQLSATDVQATLSQYGDLVEITDKVADTHEDDVLNEAVDILGEQAAQMIEKVRFNVIKAGSNVYYPGGATSRSGVNDPVSRSLQRRITRSLKQQNARQITQAGSSTPEYGTQPVASAFVALVHPDLEGDIRNMAGFTPAEEYGTTSPWESEIGKVEDVRYIYSTVIEPWDDAGATADPDSDSDNEYLSTGGSNADVYPIIYLARDAFGIVPLKGAQAISPRVINPGEVDTNDPLGQKGFVGWKAYQTAVILNDAWMVRAEVAASVNP